LEGAGHEVSHWSSIGRANAPDAEIMAWAREGGFAILTHDLDFATILAHTGMSGPSVIQIRAQDVRPAVIGQKILMALRQHEAPLVSGALVTVDPVKSRVRVLPL
jgi:predicted nuclease of predicted toxin-antitoxin system